MVVSEILRRELSFSYLKGGGIEVGALHGPLPVSGQAKVRYVDRMSVSDLRKHYPELDHVDLVDVDVIDDGEVLRTSKMILLISLSRIICWNTVKIQSVPCASILKR